MFILYRYSPILIVLCKDRCSLVLSDLLKYFEVTWETGADMFSEMGWHCVRKMVGISFENDGRNLLTCRMFDDAFGNVCLQ